VSPRQITVSPWLCACSRQDAEPSQRAPLVKSLRGSPRRSLFSTSATPLRSKRRRRLIVGTVRPGREAAWPGQSLSTRAKGLFAHVRALRPGGDEIMFFGPDGVLAETPVSVREPPGADSVTSIVYNWAQESAQLVLADASGATQRSQTVAAHGTTCWVTPLSDSLRYTVVFSPPSAPGGALWVSRGTLLFSHTVQVQVFDTIPGGPLAIWGLNPDPGKGC
jgi:hypothetical protein